VSYHTQVPNLAIDFVIPLLSEAEAKCYLFVIRRTVGFVVDMRQGAAKRKTRDRISLSQFESGMTTGDWTFNLGTGLSLNSIRKALQLLQEKGLVQSWWSCTICSHEHGADAAAGGKAVKCPSCQSPCQREFGLVPLTARRIVEFLNNNDPQRRQWTYDRKERRFRAQTAIEVEEQRSIEQSLEAFVGHLRYPDLVAQAIGAAESSLGRKLTPHQKIEGFYKPVLNMQEQAADYPQIVAQALKICLDKGKFAGKEKRLPNGRVSLRLHNKPMAYAEAIVGGELERRHRSGRIRAREGRFDPLIEQTLNEKLAQARQLNRAADKGDSEARNEARKILAEMLGKRKEYAKFLFSTGVEKEDAIKRAGALIAWAYKIGETDVTESRQERFGSDDWYPEWDWPDELPDDPVMRRSE
jgi:hypothetical protein